jgi:3-hydroxyisobutyrate dehydrogenase-like beta-hydroxyacid dehydrogenase
MNLKVGFVGLGQMGKGMAINIVKAGFGLTVYDVNPDPVRELVAKGARAAKNLSDLAKESDCLLLSLPETDTVKAVVYGENGLAKSLRSGAIIVDLSTIDYLAAVKIAEDLSTRGITFIDAPVSGMESRAKDATLTIMAGGSFESLTKIRPVLESIGNNLVYMGKNGNGQLAKLVNQLLYNISCAAMAEILPMAVKMGLEPEAISKVITTGSGQTFANTYFTPRILKNQFKGGYSLSAAYKDMASGVEISGKLKIPMPVFFAALQTYQMALALGLGDEEKGSMIKVWEKLLRVKVRSRKD